MIDFLLGVPGKLKTISDYLTTHWTAARAAKLDLITVAPAPASTALSNATWTSALATKIDANIIGLPDQPPIATNFGAGSFNPTLTTYQTAISITGSGVLQYASVGTDGSCTGYVSVTVDGVSLGEKYSTSSDVYLVGSSYAFDQIPFKTSLLIQGKRAAGGSTATVRWYLRRVT